MFLPTHPSLFFTKNDSEDIRLGDLVKNASLNDLKKNDFVIQGYPDDDGIKLNGGRTGSVEAPKLIRQFLYKMTPSFKKSFLNSKINDLGDLLLTTPDLGLRHEVVRRQATQCFKSEARLISFGGGHDYGYADAAAFLETYSTSTATSGFKKKPVVLNFDAHLDVRPPRKELPQHFHSGTSFYRLQEEYGNKFHLVEIGIQTQCNSPHHYRWAKDNGIEIVDLETLNDQGWSYLWSHTSLKNCDPEQPVYVSFDIDAITSSEAGGCSQAWATGLKTQDCLDFLSELYLKTNVRGLGIYEVSPPLDRDFQTSKTAALLAHHFIFNS